MVKDFENNKQNVEEIVIDIMRHFGYRRNYQVAQYFEVTPQTLSGWIKNGEIPAKHLMKYSIEIQKKKTEDNYEKSDNNSNQLNPNKVNGHTPKSFSWNRTKVIFKKKIKILIGLPIIFSISMGIYVFLVADPVYTSVSKVLPISEDGAANTNNFSGVAAQLGINIPLSIGGTVPWDEVYPEIVISSNLLTSILTEKYFTEKYGKITLKNILDKEHRFSGYPIQEHENRAINELRKMITISKDRLSPIVTISVETFEPIFASELLKTLIEKSGQIQRKLKTNRIREKRLFIEERLKDISTELKSLEKGLREFREYNRNISSPALQMTVQEKGREVDLQNSLYLTLKTEYEKAKIDEIERDDMVQLIDGPSIPAQLTRPRRGLSLVLTMLFGLFLSVFIIYFQERYIEN